MNMKTKKIAAILLSIASLTACHDDFLQDKAYSIITEDNYFKTSNDAITAVNGVYDALTNAGYQTSLLQLNEYTSECVTTRLTVGEAYSRWDTWNFEMGDFAGIYSGNYQLIERANQVIANVPKCDMQEELRKRVIGEATFLRALAYFNLVRVYGGVPLKTEPTTDFSTLSFPRASANEIYAQIITDLTWVYESAGIPKTSAYGAADKGRVGRSAVQALLGKVYLTRASDATVAQTGDYQKAADILKACVTEADRALVANYADLFDFTKENNTEIIFDIQFVRKSGLGGNLTAFLPTSTTQELYQISYYDYPASLDFYKSFEQDDQRRKTTFYDRMKVKIGSATVEVYFDPAGDPYTGVWRRSDDNSLVSRSIINAAVPGFRKFVDTDLTARQSSEEPNYFIMRYSDVLLMLAEALNETNNGPTTEAYNYLNMVKRRAFGKPINTPDAALDYVNLNKAAFREAVYGERRKEFVVECHAWFDGKRFWDIFTQKVASESVGADPNISNRPKSVINVSTIRDEHYKLMPFSESQLDLNMELTQNPGW
jgi:starch-binding outer membrane protein, SusD/RagB family